MSSERKKDFSQVVFLMPLRIATLALDTFAKVTGKDSRIMQISFVSIPGSGLSASSPSSVEAEKGRILGFAPKNRERTLKFLETSFEREFAPLVAIRADCNAGRDNITANPAYLSLSKWDMKIIKLDLLVFDYNFHPTSCVFLSGILKSCGWIVNNFHVLLMLYDVNVSPPSNLLLCHFFGDVRKTEF